MARTARMFEIVQMLRAARAPLTAEAMARRLEVTRRTVYRDIAALQASGVPVEGEAGIGYLLRGTLDLPPMRFTAEEMDAIVIGLSLIGRTGDAMLVAAGDSALAKIADAAPVGGPCPDTRATLVSRWHAVPPGPTDARLLRRAIRDNRKIRIAYRDGEDRLTDRIVCPLALLYYVDVLLLAGYCELRGDFRHFRHDRIEACALLETGFDAAAESLRHRWHVQNRDKLPAFLGGGSAGTG